MSHRKLLGALAIATLVVAPAAGAQTASGQKVVSDTKGFFLGAQLPYTNLSIKDPFDYSGSGIGGGLHLGYGFTPKIALLLRLDAAKVEENDEEVGDASIDLGLRYSFAAQHQNITPFVEVALTSIGAGQEDATTGEETVFAGGAFTLGGGAHYHLSSKFALTAALHWTSGKYTEGKVDDTDIPDFPEIDATKTRLSIGFTWFPMARK